MPMPPLRPGSELGEDRRVVRRREAVLLLAPLAVDLGATSARGGGGRREQEIDSQALAAVEGPAAVVPPGESLVIGMELAEHVDEARREDALEARALRVGVEDRAAELRLVPAVDRGRAEVQVPADDRAAPTVPARLEVGGERVQPAELAREVLVLRVLPVRAVERRELEVAGAYAEEARAERLLAREPPLNDLHGLAREYGDAVPAGLAVGRGEVALRLEGVAREELVGELELLETEEVGLALAQPEPHEVEPRAQPVHVPGGDGHRRDGTRGGPARLAEDLGLAAAEGPGEHVAGAQRFAHAGLVPGVPPDELEERAGLAVALRR